MKKIVHYKELYSKPTVGACVYCFTTDHPDKDNVSNTMTVRTSTVVRVGEDGEFETLNTVYRKAL